MRNAATLLICLSVPVLAAGEVAAQAFDAECQSAQLRAYNRLQSQLGDVSPEMRKILAADRKEAQSFIDRGREFNRKRAETVEKVRAEMTRVVDADPAIRAEYSRFKALEKKALQSRRFEDVRAYQKSRADLQRHYENRLTALVVGHPEVDIRNADANYLQIESNDREGKFYLRRVQADISRKARAEAVKKTLADAADRLGLNRAERSQVGRNSAWSQAVSAYGVLKAVVEQGHIRDQTVHALPKSFWDSDANVVIAELSARSLTSEMGINRVGEAFGGAPESAKYRQAIGPKTQASVSALMSKSLNNMGRASQLRRLINRALRQNDLPAAQSRPLRTVEVPSPAVPPPSQGQLGARMERIEAAADAAKRELVRYTNVLFDTTVLPRRIPSRGEDQSSGGK